MVRHSKRRGISILVLICFVLFCSPWLIEAKASSKANLIGFVYGEDGITPVKDAVVKIKHINKNKVFESTKTDDLGMFKIERIDPGLYIMGISTEEGDFNGDYLIGVKASETAKISLSLKPSLQEEKEKAEKKEKKKGLAAFFMSPTGFFIIIGATALVAYGLAKLTEKEVSPFKK
ncbi:MAG: hypothetical protein ACE5LC_04660 [Candidatus Aminicenantales bacterium]